MTTISDIFEEIGKSKLFSIIDLKDAFHSLPIREDLQEKFSFTWKKIIYSFARCPFGLKTIPQFIQRFMDYLFKNVSGVRIYNETNHLPSRFEPAY